MSAGTMAHTKCGKKGVDFHGGAALLAALSKTDVVAGMNVAETALTTGAAEAHRRRPARSEPIVFLTAATTWMGPSALTVDTVNPRCVTGQNADDRRSVGRDRHVCGPDRGHRMIVASRVDMVDTQIAHRVRGASTGRRLGTLTGIMASALLSARLLAT